MQTKTIKLNINRIIRDDMYDNISYLTKVLRGNMTKLTLSRETFSFLCYHIPTTCITVYTSMASVDRNRLGQMLGFQLYLDDSIAFGSILAGMRETSVNDAVLPVYELDLPCIIPE